MHARQCERRPHTQTIHYFVTVLDLRDLKRLTLEGTVVDICDAGMGLQTTYPLEPGHVLTFNDTMGHSAGVVRWSMPSRNNTYRVGIKFV